VKENREEGNSQRNFRDAAGLTMRQPTGKVESVRRGGDKKKVKPGKAHSSATGERK